MVYIIIGLEILYFYSSHFFIVDSNMEFSLAFKFLLEINKFYNTISDVVRMYVNWQYLTDLRRFGFNM